MAADFELQINRVQWLCHGNSCYQNKSLQTQASYIFSHGNKYYIRVNKATKLNKQDRQGNFKKAR